MFRRRKKESVKEDLELPPLEELELWVPSIISALDLQQGEFTILPAFGGIMLYIRKEGLVWIPHKEIKKALGKADKLQLTQSSAILGGTAIAAVAGASLIPILMFKGSLSLIKQSYKTLIRPPPKRILMYVESMIEKVIIVQDQKMSNKVIDKLEENPFKDEIKDSFTYKLYIKKKFFDADDLVKKNRFVSTLKHFTSPDSFPEFTIPSQSNVDKFEEILIQNGLEVERIVISEE